MPKNSPPSRNYSFSTAVLKSSSIGWFLVAPPQERSHLTAHYGVCTSSWLVVCAYPLPTPLWIFLLSTGYGAWIDTTVVTPESRKLSSRCPSNRGLPVYNIGDSTTFGYFSWVFLLRVTCLGRTISRIWLITCTKNYWFKITKSISEKEINSVVWWNKVLTKYCGSIIILAWTQEAYRSSCSKSLAGEGGYLPWLGGGGTYLARVYLPWLVGGYLPWLGTTYLGGGTYLGWGVPTLARGYLPWPGVPTLGGGYLPWPGVNRQTPVKT